jgi:hypothetical protein
MALPARQTPGARALWLALGRGIAALPLLRRPWPASASGRGVAGRGGHGRRHAPVQWAGGGGWCLDVTSRPRPGRASNSGTRSITQSARGVVAVTTGMPRRLHPRWGRSIGGADRLCARRVSCRDVVSQEQGPSPQKYAVQSKSSRGQGGVEAEREAEQVR